MSVLRHWVACGPDGEAFTVVSQDAADDWKARGYWVTGPWVDADAYRGAVDLIRDLRESLIEHAPVERNGHWAADVERLIERADTFRGQ